MLISPDFGCCDLDVDPMTFIYELDPYLLMLCQQTKNEFCASRFMKVIVLEADIQTDAEIQMLLHRW